MALLGRNMGFFLSIALLSPSVSLSADRAWYPRQDALLKGDIEVPTELANGTATKAQVTAWSESLILHHFMDSTTIDQSQADYDGDGLNEVTVGIPWTYGSDGGTYLYFDATPSGYRYLGQAPNPDPSHFRCYDSSGNCYLITAAGTWRESSIQLYQIGPASIALVATRFVTHEGLADSYLPLVEPPETEDELLARFRSQEE